MIGGFVRTGALFVALFVAISAAYGLLLGSLAGFGIVPDDGAYIEYGPLVSLVASVYGAGRWS